jgi:hypothetical protein
MVRKVPPLIFLVRRAADVVGPKPMGTQGEHNEGRHDEVAREILSCEDLEHKPHSAPDRQSQGKDKTDNPRHSRIQAPFIALTCACGNGALRGSSLQEWIAYHGTDRGAVPSFATRRKALGSAAAP